MKMVMEKQVRANPNKSRSRGRRGPKKGAIYIPPAQQEKMKELFLVGKFVSEIARETGRDWKTVAKIVRSADMVRYIDECRDKAMELIPDILEMVHKEMKKAPNKDRVRAGIDYLSRARIFEEKRTTQPVSMRQNVNQDERDIAAAKELVMSFADMAVETHRLFGMEMPEMDAVKEMLAEKKEKMRILQKLEQDSNGSAKRAFPGSRPGPVHSNPSRS